MSYFEKHLIAGEQIQYETKLHWIVMLGHVVIAIILAIVGAALLAAPWNTVNGAAQYAGPLRWVGVAGLIVAFMFLLVGLMRRGAAEMAVTNKRVIVKTGLASRRTLELLLARIESVVVEEPATGKILGYATVILRGTGGTPETFHQFAHPLPFREQVQRQIAGESKM